MTLAVPPTRNRPAVATIVSVLVCAILLALAPGAAAAPKNDDFADAKLVAVGQTLKGNINGATNQRGEPRHANSLANHSVWYRLRLRRKTTVALNTCNSNFDTILAVYTGRSIGSLRKVEFNNDGCGRSGGGSRVTFTAQRGKTYRIAVAGFADSGRFRLGAFRLSVPPNDDFADAVTIALGEAVAGTTRNATRELGEPAHEFNGSHTVWFKLSVSAATLVEVAACGGGAVTVYTGDRVGGVTRVEPTPSSTSCTKQFQAQPGVTYRMVVESGGSGAPYRFSAKAVAPTP